MFPADKHLTARQYPSLRAENRLDPRFEFVVFQRQTDGFRRDDMVIVIIINISMTITTRGGYDLRIVLKENIAPESCRRFKCASTCHTPHTSCPLWNVAVLGEIRATASAEQEASTSTKLASSCAFGHTRSPFSFSGNTSPVAKTANGRGSVR